MKIALLLLCAVAATALETRVSMERDVLFGSAPNWSREGRAGAEERVNVIVMMKHTPEQLSALESAFWAVSDPKLDATYGQHLTQEQVTEIVAAKDADIDAVTEFLHDMDYCENTTITVGAHRDLIEVDLPVAAAEKLFNTQIYRYRHNVHSTVSVLRAGEGGYSLPAPIAATVKYVANLARLPAVDGMRVVPASEIAPASGDWNNGCGSKCKNMVTPAILAQRYQLGDAPTGPTKGSMAIAEYQGVDWDQTGLDTLADACSLANVTVDHQVGDNSPAKCKVPVLGLELCGEAMLDIEYIKGVAGSIPLTDVFNKQYSLENWAKQLEDMPDGTLPLIHSVSYGNDESQQTGDDYIQACNVEFQKLGVRGVSVLFASGDQGVAGRSGGGKRFHPDFPGGSPYITAVGGTDFATRGVVGEEKAWSNGGGGFSDHFAIPAYQADAVAKYKTTAGSALPPQSYWNNTGRGYPDVAALGGQGNPYCVSVSKTLAGVAGTSASCPVVAGVFAKLNEIRLAAGKAPLGFLNPFIYQNADAFNDVTQGSNPGVQAGKGFPAVAGWDAATGVGTPNFAALAKLM